METLKTSYLYKKFIDSIYRMRGTFTSKKWKEWEKPSGKIYSDMEQEQLADLKTDETLLYSY